MLDYNKVFEIKEINLEHTNENTLMALDVLYLGEDDTMGHTDLHIEVHLDNNNAIRIIEQNEYIIEEISNNLTMQQKEHIHKVVKEALKGEF